MIKMNKHKNFLQFNGTNIVMLEKGGSYWIAIKPICETLNINFSEELNRIKSDAFLSTMVKEQPIFVKKQDKETLTNMLCIEERYVYGWLFSMDCNSEELAKYKETCFKLLAKKRINKKQ